jgi:endogenous inhibitor of DNA gyrase (YacG/DUF329 family)
MKVRCPVCKRWVTWAESPFRPFCSEFCKANDLGNWATERYRIPEEDKESPEPDPSPTARDREE